MEPYFETNHVAAFVLLTVTLAWGMMELGQHSQTADARKGATRVRFGGWLVAVLTAIACLNLALYGAPRVVPAAAIRPGAAACGVGLAVLLAGLVLRGWSIKTLGDYFTFTVMVSSDQPVIKTGPYRVLRHPGYAGILLACAGVGLASANWVAVGGAVLVPLAFLLCRIRIEERALLKTLGDPYRCYAASHKRLVPLVW
jgi:protein-S-isoprenylcysteine O-methyltransferase Ste14